MTNQANTVLSNLLGITEAFEKDIKNYLDGFDTDELLSFLDSDEKRKMLIRSYNEFSLKINKHIEGYEATVAELSLLICKSDKLCNTELTNKLSNEFDRYSILSKAVRKFILNCESVLLKKNIPIKQSTVIQYARELLVAVENYKNNF